MRRGGPPSPEMLAANGGGVAAPAETKTVYRLQGAAPAEAKIQIGLTDGSWTEVVSGLSEGEDVVTDAIVAGKPASTGGPPPGMGRRLF